MILAACEGRGNGEKDAEGLARAESREGSGRWGGWTGRREEWGGVDGNGERETGRENLEGGNGKGSNRDRKRVAMERGAMLKGGGRWEGGNREGGKGKEVRTGMERRGKRREDFTDGYDGMPGWA